MTALLNRVINACTHQGHALVSSRTSHDVLDFARAYVHQLQTWLRASWEHLDLFIGAQDVLEVFVAWLLEMLLDAQLNLVRLAFGIAMHTIKTGLLRRIALGDHAKREIHNRANLLNNFREEVSNASPRIWSFRCQHNLNINEALHASNGGKEQAR